MHGPTFPLSETATLSSWVFAHPTSPHAGRSNLRAPETFWYLEWICIQLCDCTTASSIVALSCLRKRNASWDSASCAISKVDESFNWRLSLFPHTLRNRSLLWLFQAPSHRWTKVVFSITKCSVQRFLSLERRIQEWCFFPLRLHLKIRWEQDHACLSCKLHPWTLHQSTNDSN